MQYATREEIVAYIYPGHVAIAAGKGEKNKEYNDMTPPLNTSLVTS